MTDLTDIKPCPACGKNAELRAGWAFWIECACGETSEGWTDIESAIRDWNENANEETPPDPQGPDGAKTA